MAGDLVDLLGADGLLEVVAREQVVVDDLHPARVQVLPKLAAARLAEGHLEGATGRLKNLAN